MLFRHLWQRIRRLWDRPRNRVALRLRTFFLEKPFEPLREEVRHPVDAGGFFLLDGGGLLRSGLTSGGLPKMRGEEVRLLLSLRLHLGAFVDLLDVL